VSIQLLVRQGGGAAPEEDIAAIAGREGLAVFDDKTPIVEMGQRWEQGTASVGAFVHMNPDADADYLFRPHASVKLVETATTPDTIIAWQRIEGGNDTGRISPYVPGLEVRQSIQVMDCNLDLRGLPFATEWVRPAEDSWDRLQALFAAKLAGSSSTSTLHRATTNITCDRFTNGHLVDATSPVELEAKTYPVGSEVEDILRDIMEEWGKGWGVTIHHAGGSHKCFLVQDYDDLAKFTSALKISDQVADWDPTHASAPVLEPKWARGDGKLIDQSAVISGLISIYGGTVDEPDSIYVETGEAPEDWEVWIGVYEDDLAQGIVPATRRANHILNDRKRPYVTNRPSILLEPTQVALITAGQAIQVKSVVINQNSAGAHDYVWRRIAEIRWEPNYDGRWWAHLELDRPRNSRPAVGGPATNPDPPTPPTPGTVTTATGAGAVNNDADQAVTVPASTGGLVAVLLTNAVTATAPNYFPVTAGPSEPMTIIGQITHPTPASGGNKDGDMLVVAYLANPTASGVGAHIEWGTQAGSQFGSGKGYWTTPATGTPTVITNSGTSATASVTPTGAGAEDMVLHCAGWRIWSLGNASQTPVDLSSVTDDWALPFNNSAGQNDMTWFGGHLAGGGVRSVNVVTSTPWVAAAIILGGVGGTAGDTTEPVGPTGSGSPGTGSVFTPINHVHEHGLLSDDELHYHDVSQIEGTVSYFPIDDLTDVNAPTPADADVLTWDDANSEWVAAAAAAGGDLDDLGDVNAPTPTDGDVLTWDSTPGEWISAAPSVGAFTDTVVYKSADESVSNTTLQNDDHLTFAVGANQEWVAEFLLYVTNAANTGDFKFDLSLPASAVATQSIQGLAPGSTSAEGSFKAQAIASGTALSAGVVASGTIGLNVIAIRAYVDTAGTAGNVTLQWAQNSTDGTNATVVKKGSWLRAHRVV
jgi:hypothetical protein